ncbi:hypothetical protein J4E86_005226 [Alternaria arbusti]|uniref:uncharacterized protein n=1 Tax=Alternaria arbusti TaxID=232088 RepID=UPI002220B316|nr:uncharacterized protein J4E86_005226 [Alternaria arbusti]KAI4956755.1 hypothetical protein J4E86_005226 [Alternaria arbusti]
MATNLSPPTLFTPSELKSNPTLSKSITQLVNKAFYRSYERDTAKWDNSESRFSDEEGLHMLLSGAGSVIALIFDDAASANENGSINGENTSINGEQSRKVVACASLVPWKGGWEKEGSDTETGWEVKIVCVDGDPQYHHRGLAIQLLNFLEQYLIVRETIRLEQKGLQGQRVLSVWILAAECLNGAYWRGKEEDVGAGDLELQDEF